MPYGIFFYFVKHFLTRKIIFVLWKNLYERKVKY